jgi:hypothetical protein
MANQHLRAQMSISGSRVVKFLGNRLVEGYPRWVHGLSFRLNRRDDVEKTVLVVHALLLLSALIWASASRISSALL